MRKPASPIRTLLDLDLNPTPRRVFIAFFGDQEVGLLENFPEGASDALCSGHLEGSVEMATPPPSGRGPAAPDAGRLARTGPGCRVAPAARAPPGFRGAGR